MAHSMTVQVAQRGVIVLPKALRDHYHLQPGDIVTLIDLDGVIVLNPHRSEVNALADKIQANLEARGETLESLLQAAREERDRRDRIL